MLKKSKLFIVLFFLLQFISTNTFSQINQDCNGYVGIRTTPNYKFDVNSNLSQFSYVPSYGATRKMQIYLCVTDPRIYTSSSKIVFFQTSNTWADIECRNLIEKSDSVLKEDILEIPQNNALNMILQMNAVKYKWKNTESNSNSINTTENEKYDIGFIAQEIENIVPEVVFTDDSSGIKGVSYTHIIPLLTGAIKELNAKIEILESQLADNEVKSATSTSSVNSINTEKTNAYINQNTPNPFNIQSEITYFIPSTSNSAMIIIHDMQGTEKKQYNISEKGNGRIIINGYEFNAGMYTYSLIVDGILIDTKKMLLTNN